MIALALPDGGYGVVSGDDDTMDIIPGAPVPEFDDGHASVRLLSLGPQTWFSLGARWPVPEAALREPPSPALRSLGFTGAHSQLRVAIVGTPWLTVLVADSPGAEPRELARVQTSGYPPFNAIVNLVVSPEDAAALKAAAGGEQGRATIRITAEVSPGLELDAEVLARTRLTLTEGPTPTVTASCDLADWMTSPAEQPRKETSC